MDYSIGRVNERIAHLGIHIRLAFKKDYKLISDLIETNATGHDPCAKQDYYKECNNLLLFSGDNLASYLSFTLEKTIDGETFIGLSLSCTSYEYRRKRYTTYLRMVLFHYALLNERIMYIASDVNDLSSKVLRKVGFQTCEPERYLEQFNYAYSCFVSTDDELFISKVEQFFY